MTKFKKKYKIQKSHSFVFFPKFHYFHGISNKSNKHTIKYDKKYRFKKWQQYLNLKKLKSNFFI